MKKANEGETYQKEENKPSLTFESSVCARFG